MKNEDEACGLAQVVLPLQEVQAVLQYRVDELGGSFSIYQPPADPLASGGSQVLLRIITF